MLQPLDSYCTNPNCQFVKLDFLHSFESTLTTVRPKLNANWLQNQLTNFNSKVDQVKFVSKFHPRYSASGTDSLDSWSLGVATARRFAVEGPSSVVGVVVGESTDLVAGRGLDFVDLGPSLAFK